MSPKGFFDQELAQAIVILSIGTYALRVSVSRKKDGTISHHENHLHTHIIVLLQLILNSKMGGVSSINVLFEKLHYLRGFSRVYRRYIVKQKVLFCFQKLPRFCIETTKVGHF